MGEGTTADPHAAKRPSIKAIELERLRAKQHHMPDLMAGALRLADATEALTTDDTESTFEEAREWARGLRSLVCQIGIESVKAEARQ